MDGGMASSDAKLAPVNSPRVVVFASLLLLWAGAWPAHAAEPRETQGLSTGSGRAPSGPPRLKLDGLINDREIDARLAEYGGRLLEEKEAVPSRTLRQQLDRTNFTLKTRSPSRKTLTPGEIVERNRAGVLVVAGIFKCDKCSRWHAGGGSGVMLSASGVFATACHVVSSTNHATLVILTGDGRLAPVREVLAANRRTDVAILQAEGEGFVPVPVSTNAPVGAPIWVISHPDDHFYTLSQGIVSRYFLRAAGRGRPDLTFMAITADFAKGSSGGPVFNEQGAVVGLVSSTISSYFNEDREHHKDNLQMVFKNCAPAQYILDLTK